MIRKAMMAAAALACAAPAMAEEWDFVLVNNTGKPIKAVEISAGGANSWVANKVDPEMKREGVTAAGKRMTVHFDKGSGCKYDIKATFGDDTSTVWSGINVCDNAYVTVSYADGVPTFKAS